MRAKTRELPSKPFLLKEKGFLGPIGDDLPSLIPIVFALIIFFTVFTQTFNTFDSRNILFKDSLTVIKLSDVFLGSSYIRGIEDFQRRCEIAQSIRTINWKVGLLSLDVSNLEKKPPQKFFQGIDIPNIDQSFFVLPNKQAFACSNTQEKLTYFSEETIVRFYPVALEVNFLNLPEKRFFVKPVLLVVVAWK